MYMYVYVGIGIYTIVSIVGLDLYFNMNTKKSILLAAVAYRICILDVNSMLIIIVLIVLMRVCAS